MLIRLIATGQPVSAKNGKRAFLNKRTQQMHVTRSQAIISWYAEQVPELTQQFQRLGLATIARFVHVDTHQFLRDDVMAAASPDGDNVMSAAWDALVKAKVLKDDKLVVTWGGSRQRDSARPRVEIEVRVLDGGAVIDGWR